MDKNGTVQLETSQDVLEFDQTSGRLVSFRSQSAPDQEFISSGDADPVCVLQYLDQERCYRRFTSNEAREVEVVRTISAGKEQLFEVHLRKLGGLDVNATITVRASTRSRFSTWSIAIHNGADVLITDVQFPVIVVSYQLAGKPGSEALLWPLGAGILYQAPQPHYFKPDCPHTWQICPENHDSLHYPGYTIAQFLAYYNDRAGILVSCQDSSGRVKLIQPVHHEPGLRLGMSHVGDWPRKGERKLEYEVAVGSFTGDWYAAAELYRSWGLRQSWAKTPLHSRKDIPQWLLDSPPHIILRMQGILDAGPTQPIAEFLPYAKCIPLLENLSQRIEAPLVPVIMSWERPGPWIYPDCFPPIGGSDSLREFSDLARKRGWHIGTFCNGTRWVTGHYWSGYEGEEYLRERDGIKSICRTATGDLWKEDWDATWRPSYPCCLGVPRTRKIARDFVDTIIDLGLDWIQFFDQNVGCATFPCFAADHDHPPVPGRWMTEKMLLLLNLFHKRAEEEFERSGGERQIVFSVEGPANEYVLPYLHLCDIRVVPPGHRFGAPGFGGHFVPLFHFLYHEFILIQGGFGTGPEPYHLPIRNAYNAVIGEIPGAVMKGDGALLNKDTMNWAPWEPQVGSNEDAFEMLRTTTALRRGPAKDFLVYGRMCSPSSVAGIEVMRWHNGGKYHQIPAVFHAAWQAPDGRFGLVLANWTGKTQEVQVSEPRLGGEAIQHTSSQQMESKSFVANEQRIKISLPRLSCALVASKDSLE